MNEKICRVLQILLAVALFVLPAGCTRTEETPPAGQSRVSATKAYMKFFGPAPLTDKGSCFAFVIYFPSAKYPEKVVPFPFFTFDEVSIRKVAVERLLSGMGVGSYRGEFLSPFPTGTHLLGISDEMGVVTADFGGELHKLDAKAACGKGGGLEAIALTLAQFGGVREIRLDIEGKGGDIPFADSCVVQQPLRIDYEAVREPGPPRLLEVVAVKEKGKSGIESGQAYFDRPVDIGEITISDKWGKPFAGDIFRSVFDMVAVLKPKDPSLFKAGMPVVVRWRVVDRVGRPAQGAQMFHLEMKEH